VTENVWVFDTEIYQNYFLAAFKSLSTGEVVTFERSDRSDFDGRDLSRFLRREKTVGFNSNNFDMPLVFLAAQQNKTPPQLIEVVTEIIENRKRSWELERLYSFRIPRCNHIDLIEVAPGTASLKIYGGRLHAPKLQDLPYPPGSTLTEAQCEAVKLYCVNDLDTTGLLYKKLLPQIGLRETMSEKYGQELRSKSDAQIAEAVIKAQIADITGTTPTRPSVKPGTVYHYDVPYFIDFRSDVMKRVLATVRDAEFVLSYTHKIDMPPALNDAPIPIGNSLYRMGIGGLHSSESCVSHVVDDDTILVDRDVASYYPMIILNQDLFPSHIGRDFLTVYRSIVEERLAAKAAGDTVRANSLKITINGSFGKFGSKWSSLFSPNLLIQTTVTGQLALLMLIERLEAVGIPVVSANTDGLVIKCPRRREPDMAEVVSEWEQDTSFSTEATEYRALYSRDVNNYIALKHGGGVKTKGAYADAGLMKNPANQICMDAVVAKLTHGTPISETVYSCGDITRFVTVRTVNGGAVKDNQFLGKAVRWYYAIGETGAIHYKTNGNRVSRSMGARPLMDLPDAFPSDVNHWWYVEEAARILSDIGWGVEDPILDLIGAT
jgi:DNA polymerase elongation subunit (family B)